MITGDFDIQTKTVFNNGKKSDESANYPAEKGKSWQFYAIAVPRGQDRKGPQGTMVRFGPDISGPQDRVVRSLVADYRTGTAPFRGLQDTRHVLLHCTNQAGPRMRHLMQGSRRELDYRAYLTRPDLVPKAVRFMLETGLLSQFQTLPTTYRATTTDRNHLAV